MIPADVAYVLYSFPAKRAYVSQYGNIAAKLSFDAKICREDS